MELSKWKIVLFVIFELTFHIDGYLDRRKICSLEFSLVGSKCYYFSKEMTNWNEAYYQCLSKNSSLAILKNRNEEKQIKNYFKQYSESIGERYHWIGGKFDSRKRRWIWGETGEPIIRTLKDPISKNKELVQWACLMMEPRRSNKWYFKSCFNQNYYICEKNAKISRSTNLESANKLNIQICQWKPEQLNEDQKKNCLRLNADFGKNFTNIPGSLVRKPKLNVKRQKDYVCPFNMFIIKNRCYYFSHEKLNWNDAYWACRDNKSTLAVIQNRVQDKLLREFLSKGFIAKHERWIGGLYDWKKGRWLWGISGKPLRYNGFAFKNNIGTKFEWKSTTIDPNLGYKWNARLRTDLKYYICHKKAKSIVKLEDNNSVF